MAHSPDDAPLARGNLADSEETLLPLAAPRGWEECTLSIAAVCAVSLKNIIIFNKVHLFKLAHTDRAE